MHVLVRIFSIVLASIASRVLGAVGILSGNIWVAIAMGAVGFWGVLVPGMIWASRLKARKAAGFGQQSTAQP